jgi:hypothetical protein
MDAKYKPVRMHCLCGCWEQNSTPHSTSAFEDRAPQQTYRTQKKILVGPSAWNEFLWVPTAISQSPAVHRHCAVGASTSTTQPQKKQETAQVMHVHASASRTSCAGRVSGGLALRMKESFPLTSFLPALVNSMWIASPSAFKTCMRRWGTFMPSWGADEGRMSPA